ncbi:MAG: hypothetical protein B6240_13070 [Desulfobacteraceae bacterium 4572_87]|nr:MAG: hypothetical protein B6240_13070 [Desulfobacteraceae bacterium 4572_87]
MCSGLCSGPCSDPDFFIFQSIRLFEWLENYLEVCRWGPTFIGFLKCRYSLTYSPSFHFSRPQREDARTPEKPSK